MVRYSKLRRPVSDAGCRVVSFAGHIGQLLCVFKRHEVKNLLFICGKNKLRSPTAEAVFSSWAGIQTDSAGINADADTVVSQDQIQWSDMIFVMENAHRIKLTRKFSSDLKGKQVVCLNIPDKFQYMQPELVRMLEARVGKYLK